MPLMAFQRGTVLHHASLPRAPLRDPPSSASLKRICKGRLAGSRRRCTTIVRSSGMLRMWRSLDLSPGARMFEAAWWTGIRVDRMVDDVWSASGAAGPWTKMDLHSLIIIV
jgi:hypothetical protein